MPRRSVDMRLALTGTVLSLFHSLPLRTMYAGNERKRPAVDAEKL